MKKITSLVLAAGLVSTLFFTTAYGQASTQDLQAVKQDLEAKHAECREIAFGDARRVGRSPDEALRNSGTKASQTARVCANSCSLAIRIIDEDTLGTGVDQCRTQHAESLQAYAEFESIHNDAKAAEAAKIETMPDVEGVYVTVRRTRYVVRAENRSDWNKICLGSSRLKSAEQLRGIRAGTRVRLTGITYDPGLVGKIKLSECMVESAVILD